MPELLAVVHSSRALPSLPALTAAQEVAGFLRRPENYPLFAKPIEGKYSLNVFSADAFDPATDSVRLRGHVAAMSVEDMANALDGRPDGFLIQRRLEPAAPIAAAFGARLWSIRALVLLTPDGPVLHRATAKIPTGDNPADNYWRSGNALGALDPETGVIHRAVTGWAEHLQVLDRHPDTGEALAGKVIPDWPALLSLIHAAAPLLPGIRTQSWDIAVTATGPIVLEANFGGDLSLAQIASGRGTLDPVYRAHLAQLGYGIG